MAASAAGEGREEQVVEYQADGAWCGDECGYVVQSPLIGEVVAVVEVVIY